MMLAFRKNLKMEKCPNKREFYRQVILSGGSAKIPKLQQLVSDAFPQADFLCSILPDEVLAAGASTEAALLLGQPMHSPLASTTVPALASSIFCMVIIYSFIIFR